MPRKSPITSETEEVRSDIAETTGVSPTTTDEKLDLIVNYLHHMDRRDRMRTVGAFFHGIITTIPIIIFLASAWYFYNHGDEVLKQLTDMSVKSAASFSQETLQEQLDKYMGKPKQ